MQITISEDELRKYTSEVNTWARMIAQELVHTVHTVPTEHDMHFSTRVRNPEMIRAKAEKLFEDKPFPKLLPSL